ncbi:DUF2239 family protein [Phenylobacterium sp. NIBR 498073]|uniref:DUF2239 family protein n=2 Tax=unclassified Phenylobacterium TaxID=2640670 RepID=UPI0022B2CC09|nr:DUF2239 family protein [Phenylobacterium sp. NIBR 498073]MBS0490045.1 DUF2239 family protein [Pseudomonadota bacterium]WGU39081.1 DUF2239 family protein [Phenylobacterium sp. NIBR 498073]
MADMHTAFSGHRKIANGPLAVVAPAVKAAIDAGESHVLVFDDKSGRQVDLDLRGTMEDVIARLVTPTGEPPRAPGRGRPKLGVTAREVTLLPSHWEWLAAQPGGASAALRRLVDQARRSGGDDQRQAQEAAHRIMFALAGDFSDFEEATRAFYAGDWDQFLALSENWPIDPRDYVRVLAERAFSTR